MEMDRWRYEPISPVTLGSKSSSCMFILATVFVLNFLATILPAHIGPARFSTPHQASQVVFVDFRSAQPGDCIIDTVSRV